MVRISGVDIPDDKRIEIALTYIRGIGRRSSGGVLQRVGIDPDVRAKSLSPEQVAAIRAEIDKGYTVEGALAQSTRFNIKRLKDIRCYRGLRHERGLPARGQRTKTNARTRKGKKLAVGGTKAARERH